MAEPVPFNKADSLTLDDQFKVCPAATQPLSLALALDANKQATADNESVTKAANRVKAAEDELAAAKKELEDAKKKASISNGRNAALTNDYIRCVVRNWFEMQHACIPKTCSAEFRGSNFH